MSSFENLPHCTSFITIQNSSFCKNMEKFFPIQINMGKNYVGTSSIEQDNILCVSLCDLCCDVLTVGVFEGSAAPLHYCTTS